MSSVYVEDNIHDFGVANNWYNAKIVDSFKTYRGTKVEMIERKLWGLTCYMDNSIQSSLTDEKIYHEALVHPVMENVMKRTRVLIVGGGEGATAREVLKWQGVEQVDMYEWDADVVSFFKEKYPQWANGAWNDPRLTIYNEDIFSSIQTPPNESKKYDVIIIDLFDPSEQNMEQWSILIKSLNKWCKVTGSIVMYAGMRNILKKEQSYITLTIKLITEYNVNNPLKTTDIIPYHVWIPSFSGESVFLLIKKYNNENQLLFREAENMKSHITPKIWESYTTFNW